MVKKEIEDKLQLLRQLWTKYPEQRKVIEIRAKLLKKALEKYDRVYR